MANPTPRPPLIPARPLRYAARSALLLLLLAAPAAWGQADGDAPPDDQRNLADLSLEELMNETVTSVSKRAQRLGDAAAAIFVLSRDDLRRSGATSIADALRLVPGLDVGTVNSSQWAISARGFNTVYANKLLVLVDGRAVYTPLNAGVYWDLQGTMLEDIDRIEVIRGPGATLWGANAVNGVINVVTRSAEETQGGLAYAGGGNLTEAMGGLRYGGRIGEKTYYRAFASYHQNADGRLADGGSARDDWQAESGGFRLDREPQPGTHVTWQGDATGLSLDHDAADSFNVNTLGRWSRDYSSRSNVELQAYFDRTYRDEPLRSRVTMDTLDLTGQKTFGWGERQDVIWGAGCRLLISRIEGTNPLITVRDGSQDLKLFSAFVQDEIRLVPNRFTLTAGVKLEHNDFTGLEIQPTLRAVLKPTESQTLWAATSRAVRTPSELEGRDLFGIPAGPLVTGPDGGLYVPILLGNPDLVAEVLWAYELGYRIQPAKDVHLDVAAFYNDYSDLVAVGGIQRFVPGRPVGTAVVLFDNLLSASTYGGEATVRVTPAASWRLTASYSLIVARIRGPLRVTRDQALDPPKHQLALLSSLDLGPRMSIDGQLRYVDRISLVPSYVTADLRLGYRATDRLELALVGQNLLEDRHLEQQEFFFAARAEVSRGFYAKVIWHF